jgi:glycogen operon protein
VEQRLPLMERSAGVWHGYVPGVGLVSTTDTGCTGRGFPEVGHRFNPAKLLLDPYARAVDGRLVVPTSSTGHIQGGDDTAP